MHVFLYGTQSLTRLSQAHVHTRWHCQIKTELVDLQGHLKKKKSIFWYVLICQLIRIIIRYVDI